MKKTIVLTMAIMLLGVTTSFAQKPEQNRKGYAPLQVTAENRAERMAKELDLTDQQKAEVLALFKKQDAEREKKQENAQKNREAKQAAFQRERKTQDTELKEIIGEEKFQQLEKNRAERQEKMKNGQRTK